MARDRADRPPRASCWCCPRRRARARPRCRAFCSTQEKNIELSISVTTRARRAERDRRHATIISSTASNSSAMATHGELLEWAEVFGNCYGTPREPVEAALAAGPRRAVRHRLAGHAATCADDARATSSACSCCRRRSPNWRRRLRSARAGRHDDVIRAPHGARRSSEMSHWAEYDYVVDQRRSRPDASRACARSSRPSGSSA